MHSSTIATTLLALVTLGSAAPKAAEQGKHVPAKLAAWQAAASQAVTPRAAPAISIPKDCVVCGGLSLGCIAACIAGGPLDPACDICAGASIAVYTECLSCIADEV